MDHLQYSTFIEAYCLVGIVATLRKMYQPRFEPSERIKAALDALARGEQTAIRPLERRVLVPAE